MFNYHLCCVVTFLKQTFHITIRMGGGGGGGFLLHEKFTKNTEEIEIKKTKAKNKTMNIIMYRKINTRVNQSSHHTLEG